MTSLGNALRFGATNPAVTDARFYLSALVAALALGLMIAFLGRIALALLAIPLSFAVLHQARWRILTLALGPLVFSSSEGLSAIKVGYMALLALSVAGAWWSLGRATTSGQIPIKLVRQAELASLIFVGLIGISLPVAYFNDHEIANWFRDASPYVLVAFAPMLALDASEQVSERFVLTLLVVTGLFATASFVVTNLALREAASLSIDRIGLVSFQLPSALFAVAFSFGLSDRRQRQAWWLLAGGIFAALLVTGTRSALLLLLVPLVVVLVSPGRQRRRAIQSVAVAGISVILVFNLAGAVAGVATDWTSQRLFTVQDVIAAPESDASLGVRLDQSAESWELFEANPLLGVGPGHIFHWTLHGEVRQSFTVDTSVSYLAKFGAGGLAILIAFFFIVARLVRDGLAEGNGLDEGLAALLAFSVVTLTVATLGAPLEDKGFAISLVLLLVLAFKREAEGRRSAASRSRPQSPHRLKVV